MGEEKEIKLAISSSKKDLIKKLLAFNSKPINKVSQEDIYYDFKDCKLLGFDHVLRVRIENKKACYFDFKTIFHIPNRKNPWYIDEVRFEFPIKDELRFNDLFFRLGIKLSAIKFPLGFSELDSLLKQAGLNPAIKIIKKRNIFEKESLLFMVDDVKDLGLFLEIEGENLNEVVKQLDLENEERFILGYTNLYLKKFFNKDPEEKMKRFKEDPAWNVFECEKKLLLNLCEEN